MRSMANLTRQPVYDSHFGETGPAFAAGVTKKNKDIEELRKFEALFGRDSIRMAVDVFKEKPLLLETTLGKLAELQGVTENTYSEEEPGRIIHESRDPQVDEIAREITKNDGWEWPYYGSVDATPSFVVAIHKYVTQTPEGPAFLEKEYIGKDGKEHTMLTALEASVDWIKTRMDSNPEGLLEFKAKFPKSIENQVWKDSWDSYHHADGTMANHEQGIASVEVQALAYDALLDAAELYEHLPTEQSAKYEKEIKELRSRAQNLREQVLTKFWIEDKNGGYFALGTDRDDSGNLRQLQIRTSNMGHLLNSRILDGDDEAITSKREAIIKTLFAPNMLNASGIRTLANDGVRFRPGAYHNGNVWLWDTYLISQGLERQGYYGLSWELNKRIWSVYNKFNIFPEFARGGNETEPMLNTRTIDIWDEDNNRNNRIEQRPQELQGWSVAALLDIKYKYGALTGRNKRIPNMHEFATDPEKRAFENSILAKL